MKRANCNGLGKHRGNAVKVLCAENRGVRKRKRVPRNAVGDEEEVAERSRDSKVEA
jgi:hypothetical protein